MATETIQGPAPVMPAVAGRAATRGGGGAGGGSSSSRAGLPLPPRRGQIMEKILKDVIAAVAAMAAGLLAKNNRGDGEEGLPASDDADDK